VVNTTSTHDANSRVDSYKSSLGAYGGSNIGSQGNVQAGQGILVQPGGIITGTQLPNTPPYLTPLPTPAGNITNLGTLLVSAGQTLNLQTGDYLATDVTINKGGVLQALGGQVRLWFSGNLNQSGQILADKPNDLWLIGNSTNGNSHLNAGSITDAVIYAPGTTVFLNAPLFGALYCNSATLNTGGAIHYDEDLNCTGSSGVLASLARSSVSRGYRGILPQGKVLILYPNPSHGQANVVYRLDATGQVELTILNVAGEVCQRDLLGQQGQGVQTIALDLNRLASGIYLIELTSNQGHGQIQNARFKFALVH
jgi:hypothetical protein